MNRTTTGLSVEIRNQNSEIINSFNCPKCGAEIPLSEAVSHGLREQLAAQYDQRLEVEKTKLATEAARAARENLSLELTDLRNQLQEKVSKLESAQAGELTLRKEKRALEEARQNLQLDLTRQLDAERQQIADTARQHAIASERLKLNDKDLVIKGLTDQITALKQRAEQGAIQIQGESLETALYDDLRTAFLFDQVAEVKNGERGADVLQHVRTNTGLDCGAILWETKRARNWSATWVDKLKDDQRSAKAELAVLVVTCLPPEVRGIAQVDGIWVCEPPYACALAGALRHGLVSVAVQRTQEIGRADKMTQLYNYLCGVEFRQSIQAVVEAFEALRDQIAAERRAFDKQWKEREKHLGTALQHTALLYGSIQGIAGRAALPEIPCFQLPPNL